MAAHLRPRKAQAELFTQRAKIDSRGVPEEDEHESELREHVNHTLVGIHAERRQAPPSKEQAQQDEHHGRRDHRAFEAPRYQAVPEYEKRDPYEHLRVHETE